MQGKGCQKAIFTIWMMGGALLGSNVCARAQESPPATASSRLQKEPSVDVRALTDSLLELRNQVQALNAEVSELRLEQQNTQAEDRLLRDELGEMRQQLAEQPRADNRSNLYAPYFPSGSPSAAAGSSAGSMRATQKQTTDQRMARLEESEEMTAANVREQSQSKVESGSKYRLRLSGIVLLNMFENRGTVDNLDIPVVALRPRLLDSGGDWGGTLRQSQVGIEAFGPDIAGAHTSANLAFDFAGGFINAQDGATKPLVRLRTGTIRLDWANASVVAGQDSLFFVPLSPSSLASLAVPALAYAGDLWSWTPQVRVEKRIRLGRASHLLLQGGILDSLTGDVAMPDYQRYPSWGEKSGQPAYAGRIAWSRPAFGEDLTLGIGGYYGDQDWGFGRDVQGWAGTVDMHLPLGEFFELSAAFYRGRAVGGLGGGIGQTVVTAGSLADPSTIVRGLDSIGGWAQLKFKPRPNFEVNGALGEDNPFASQLRRFPGSPAYYGSSLSRNVSPFVNFIYQLRSDVLFSAEYRRLQTFVVSDSSQKANLVDLSLGYTF
jgi:hypothetical protein